MCSTNGTVPSDGRVRLPTAVHDRVVAHDTPKRKLLVAWRGETLGSILQRTPFHRSINGSGAPAALTA
jgi:hypothetical protein